MSRALIAVLAMVLTPVVHEAGHWAAARCLGHKLHWYFRKGKIGPLPIPRFLWDMPDGSSKEHRRAVAQSGFLAEFVWGVFCLLLSPLGLLPMAVGLIHFALYPWYTGDWSDFKWF